MLPTVVGGISFRMPHLFYSDTPWIGAALFALFGFAGAALLWCLARLVARWNRAGFEQTREGRAVRIIMFGGATVSIIFGLAGSVFIFANLDYFRGEHSRQMGRHISTAKYLGAYAEAVESGSFLKSLFLDNIAAVPLTEIHRAVSDAYFALDEFEKAFESLKRTRGPHEDEEIAYEAFANQLESHGRLKLAAEHYEKLARRRTNDAQAPYRAAACYLGMGDRDQAVHWAKIYLMRTGKPETTLAEIEEVFRQINS
ncbi:MAG: hypothetical protein RDV41_12360, partial [Planctomycetota bacterium]|nr:hypothetical protein [Planctomycetota bacterium]